MENGILSLKLLHAAIYGWKTGPSSVLHFLQHGYVPPVERGLLLKWGKIQGKSFSVNYVLTVLCVRQQHKNRSLRCSNHFVGFLNLAMHSKGIWLFSVILVECSNYTTALGILKVQDHKLKRYTIFIIYFMIFEFYFKSLNAKLILMLWILYLKNQIFQWNCYKKYCVKRQPKPPNKLTKRGKIKQKIKDKRYLLS